MEVFISSYYDGYLYVRFTFFGKSRNKNIKATGYTKFTKFTDKSFDQKKSAKLFIELVKFCQKISPYDNETIWILSSNLSPSIW